MLRSYTYTAILMIMPKLAIVQLASATICQPMAANLMPIEGALALPWTELVLDSKSSYWWFSSKAILFACLANMATTTPTMVVAVLLRQKYLFVGDE